MSLSSYFISCIDENQVIRTGYLTEKPTVCPHNNTHSIDQSFTSKADTLYTQTVQIDQGGVNNKYHKTEGYNIDITAGPNVDTSFTHVVPFPLVPRLLTIYPDSSNIGDSFSVIIADQTPTGPIIASANPGDTSVTVHPAVVAHLSEGFLLYIRDGTNSDVCDIITSIVGNVVSFNVPLIHSFNTGAIVYFSIARCTNLTIKTDQQLFIGSNTLTSSELPKNIPVKLVYTNKSSSSKTIAFSMEYYYGK